MSGPERGGLVVEAFRGALVESRHVVDAAIDDGAATRAFGDIDVPVFLRSSAKPFQAAAVVLAGAVDRFAIAADELALVAASHGGEEMHTTRVARLLARLGLDAAALRCGTHPPFHEPTARALGAPPSPLHHNCSGKHAGMLAAALCLGVAPERYLDPAGTVQQLMRRTVADACGMESSAVGVAIDGCGAVTFAVPLRGAARAFRALARPETANRALGDALARVGDAMRLHPELVGGSGRFDTRLMRVTAGALISKAGAEGVQGLADRVRGAGACLKVRDGAARAVAPATIELIVATGLLDAEAASALEDERHPAIGNAAGQSVGRLAARFAS